MYINVNNKLPLTSSALLIFRCDLHIIFVLYHTYKIQHVKKISGFNSQRKASKTGVCQKLYNTIQLKALDL